MKVFSSILVCLLVLPLAGCDQPEEAKLVDYKIVAPNGVTYRVTNAPPGLGKDQIVELLLREHPEAGVEPMPMPGAEGGMVVGGPLNGTLMPGAEGGMVVGGPLNGTLMPGAEGGMVVGGPLNGTLMPPH